jgi:hypothetical protein
MITLNEALKMTEQSKELARSASAIYQRYDDRLNEMFKGLKSCNTSLAQVKDLIAIEFTYSERKEIQQIAIEFDLSLPFNS